MHKVLLSPLVYHLLRSTPEGVVTLNNAEDRMYSYLGPYSLYSKVNESKGNVTFMDNDGNTIHMVVPASEILNVRTMSIAKLASAPDGFDVKKGISHEFEFDIGTETSDLVSKFASFLKTTVDNNFYKAYLLGNAIYRWVDEKGVCSRESESSLPSGTYTFNMCTLTIWERSLVPVYNGRGYQVGEQWFDPQPSFDVGYTLRKSTCTVVLNQGDSSSLSGPVGKGKGNKSKKKKIDSPRKDSCILKQQPMQM